MQQFGRQSPTVMPHYKEAVSIGADDDGPRGGPARATAARPEGSGAGAGRPASAGSSRNETTESDRSILGAPGALLQAMIGAETNASRACGRRSNTNIVSAVGGLQRDRYAYETLSFWNRRIVKATVSTAGATI